MTTNHHVLEGITKNNIIWAFRSLEVANWHPFTWISHMLDVQLFGQNPRGHHLTNLIIHCFNTVLLFFLLMYMTGSIWRSAAVALFFAIHPMHVESVAWISERKDVLSTFFALISIFFYALFSRKNSKVSFLCSILFYIFALFSKPMVVSLPLLLVLFDIWPLQRWVPDLKNVQKAISLFVIEKLPFYIVTIFSCIITVVAQQKLGAVIALDTFTLSERVLHIPTSYWLYVEKLFVPLKLSLLYPLQIKHSLSSILFSLIVIVTVSIYSVFRIKRNPFFFTGWFWFIITLIPVIGIIQVGNQEIANRYSYVPYIGLFIVAIWQVHILAIKSRLLLIICSSVILGAAAICITLTIKEVGYWKNSVVLYEHSVNNTKNNYIMHDMLAVVLSREGKLDEAIKHHLKALELRKVKKFFLNLSKTYYRKKEYHFSLMCLRNALLFDSTNAAIICSMGHTFYKMDEPDSARYYYEKAIFFDSCNFQAFNNLGMMNEDVEKGIYLFSRAVECNSKDVPSHYNRAIRYHALYRYAEAEKDYRRIVEINPNFSQIWYLLSRLKLEQDSTTKADLLFKKALQCDTLIRQAGTRKRLDDLIMSLRDKKTGFPADSIQNGFLEDDN
ncbi:MAG: tetratricopeptide repeat protein [Chitinivibrionales bacterium]|nr:tetratricopeptide repeat protein [Chitinivibrionales bacterium]